MTMLHNRRRPDRRRRDGGAALVVVLMVMMGLLGLGITALWLTGGNLQVGANMNMRMQALYVAEAGVDHARELLNTTPGPDLHLLLSGSGHALDDPPTGLTTVRQAPNGLGVIFVDQATNTPLVDVAYPPTSFGRTGGTADAPTPTLMGRYTLWVRNDTAEIRMAVGAGQAWNDPANQWNNDGNGAVVVRSRGVALDGRTQVVLEVTMGWAPGSPATNPGPPNNPSVLCNAGKNSCDDNNSVISGIVVE